MRATGVRPQGRSHAQSGARGIGGALGGNALAVHARALAAAAARFSLDELGEFVDELPRSQFHLLRYACKQRLYTERAAIVPVPPPAPPPSLLSTRAAATYLDCSPDEIRDRVRRGTLAAVRDRPGGRLHFDRTTLEEYKNAHRTVASGIVPRYDAAHDTRYPASPPPAAPVDATAARQRARRDRDRGQPLGTRRAQDHAPRHDRPYAPGKGAWADPPPPPKPRVDERGPRTPDSED